MPKRNSNTKIQRFDLGGQGADLLPVADGDLLSVDDIVDVLRNVIAMADPDAPYLDSYEAGSRRGRVNLADDLLRWLGEKQ